MLLPVVSRTRDGVVREVSSDEGIDKTRRMSGDDLQRRLAEFVRGYLDEFEADEERRRRERSNGHGDKPSRGEEGGKGSGISEDPEHVPTPPRLRRVPIERLEGTEAIQALIRSSRSGTSFLFRVGYTR